MITHADLFNRALAENDYAAVMAVEDAIEKDLDAANAEYQKAVEVWELASEKLRAENSARYDFDYDLAYIEMQKKYVAYLEKSMLNSAFHGFYQKG